MCPPIWSATLRRTRAAPPATRAPSGPHLPLVVPAKAGTQRNHDAWTTRVLSQPPPRPPFVVPAPPHGTWASPSPIVVPAKAGTQRNHDAWTTRVLLQPPPRPPFVVPAPPHGTRASPSSYPRPSRRTRTSPSSFPRRREPSATTTRGPPEFFCSPHLGHPSSYPRPLTVRGPPLVVPAPLPSHPHLPIVVPAKAGTQRNHDAWTTRVLSQPPPRPPFVVPAPPHGTWASPSSYPRPSRRTRTSPSSFPRRREPSATTTRGPPEFSRSPHLGHPSSYPRPLTVRGPPPRRTRAPPAPAPPHRRSREGGNPAQPRRVDHPSSLAAPTSATLPYPRPLTVVVPATRSRSREGGNPAQPRRVDHPSSLRDPTSATLRRTRAPSRYVGLPLVVPAKAGTQRNHDAWTTRVLSRSHLVVPAPPHSKGGNPAQPRHANQPRSATILTPDCSRVPCIAG